MRHGRSVVIESDHVVLLGASDRLPILLPQLVLAGTEGGSRTIVLLADIDPDDMHSLAQSAGTERGVTRIVYRFGDRTSPDDLALVQLSASRAAIVLSDGQSDVAAVETVLAIAAELGGFDDLTLVVEVLEQETAQRLHRACGTRVHPIVSSEAVARTTAVALRQRGLGQIVRELFAFRGSDLHLVERPDLTGTPFGRLVTTLTNARPIGTLRENGRIEIAPAFDALLRSGDRLISIAENVEHLELSDRSRPTAGPADSPTTVVAAPCDERLVGIGWNDFGRHVLQGLAASAAPTATVALLIDTDSIDIEQLEVPDLGPGHPER